MVYSQLNPPSPQFEEVDTQDLGVLDKTSITSVVGFMQKFQEDATFSPPTVDVLFDSEKYDINIDSDDEVLGQFSELEDFEENPKNSKPE